MTESLAALEKLCSNESDGGESHTTSTAISAPAARAFGAIVDPNSLTEEDLMEIMRRAAQKDDEQNQSAHITNSGSLASTRSRGSIRRKQKEKQHSSSSNLSSASDSSETLGNVRARSASSTSSSPITLRRASTSASMQQSQQPNVSDANAVKLYATPARAPPLPPDPEVDAALRAAVGHLKHAMQRNDSKYTPQQWFKRVQNALDDVASALRDMQRSDVRSAAACNRVLAVLDSVSVTAQMALKHADQREQVRFKPFFLLISNFLLLLLSSMKIEMK